MPLTVVSDVKSLDPPVHSSRSRRHIEFDALVKKGRAYPDHYLNLKKHREIAGVTVKEEHVEVHTLPLGNAAEASDHISEGPSDLPVYLHPSSQVSGGTVAHEDISHADLRNSPSRSQSLDSDTYSTPRVEFKRAFESSIQDQPDRQSAEVKPKLGSTGSRHTSAVAEDTSRIKSTTNNPISKECGPPSVKPSVSFPTRLFTATERLDTPHKHILPVTQIRTRPKAVKRRRLSPSPAESSSSDSDAFVPSTSTANHSEPILSNKHDFGDMGTATPARSSHRDSRLHTDTPAPSRPQAPAKQHSYARRSDWERRVFTELHGDIRCIFCPPLPGLKPRGTIHRLPDAAIRHLREFCPNFEKSEMYRRHRGDELSLTLSRKHVVARVIKANEKVAVAQVHCRQNEAYNKRCTEVGLSPVDVETKLKRYAVLYKIEDCKCCPLPSYSQYLASLTGGAGGQGLNVHEQLRMNDGKSKGKRLMDFGEHVQIQEPVKKQKQGRENAIRIPDTKIEPKSKKGRKVVALLSDGHHEEEDQVVLMLESDSDGRENVVSSVLLLQAEN